MAGFWLLLGFVGYGVWAHAYVGRKAYAVAKAYTSEQGVMLLDQTVVLKSMRVRFSGASGLALERRFGFEFATFGDRRYRGTVIFLGHHPVHKTMQAFKVEPSPVPLNKTEE